MLDLRVLEQNREALLLAEVAAWLHDIGKFCNLHVEATTGGPRNWSNNHAYKAVSDNPRGIISLSKTAANLKKPDSLNGVLNAQSPKIADFLSPQAKASLETKIVDLLGERYTLAEVIMLGVPGFATFLTRAQLLDGRDGWIPAVLGVCHSESHHDKQEPRDGQQRYPNIFISNAFGFECDHTRVRLGNSPDSLDARLARLPIDSPNLDLIARLGEEMRYGLGDTRRPINEITLTDWASIVASLFKSAISLRVLEGRKRDIRRWASWRDKIIDHDIAWRLLSIRTDGLGYLLNAPSIPDMLARRDLLTDAWDQVQDLLEETYPLGLEVYRDENGGLFVVPDVENITSELVDVATGKTLRQLILEAFDQGTVHDNSGLCVSGEIIPDLYADLQPWSGKPDLPPVGEHLQREIELTSNTIIIADAWDGRQEQICTVCGLRPQGPSEKAKKRGVCDVCESRRDDRAEKWVGGIHLSHEERSQQNKPETIWLDEVADANGRLALLVGQFDLEHWLDGSLVRTLAVRKPNDTNGHAADVAKNPSFARIRRIWETTKRFWEEITDGLGKLVGQAGPRLEIRGRLSPRIPGNTPGPYHAYELVLGNVKVAIIWDPKQKRFITAENLVYIARQLGHTVNDHQEAARIVLQHIKGTLTIEEPVGYGGRNKKWGTITIDDGDDPAGPARQGASPLRPDGDASPLRPDGDASPLRPYRYDPTIPILAEPRTFTALVPADRALDVVQAIKIKYEREMGKVRNRLPLHLGIVYADAHMPLRAVLDAGRRMLEQRMPPESWRVVCSAKRALGDGDPLPDRFEADQAGQFRRWVEVTLEREGRRITWYVPAMMGDGQTEDNWYPYVFIESLAPNGHTRSRRFEVPNPWTGQDGTLVHVAELRPDDLVYFTPATLDFIWLDSSGRRFEVAYDSDGHRQSLPRRPYLLDELKTLETIWQTLTGHLTTTQIHALNSLIENKREEWTADNGVFRQFCRDVLANAEWQSHPWEKDREGWLDTWADYAVRGWIADAVELYHHIMKESGKE